MSYNPFMKYEITLDKSFVENVFLTLDSLSKNNTDDGFYKLLHRSAQLELEGLFNSCGLNTKTHQVSNKSFSKSPNIKLVDKVYSSEEYDSTTINNEHPFYQIYKQDNYDKSNIEVAITTTIRFNYDRVLDEQTMCIDGVYYFADEDEISIDGVPKKGTLRLDDNNVDIDKNGEWYINGKKLILSELDDAIFDDSGNLISSDGVLDGDTFIYNQLLESKNNKLYLNNVPVTEEDFYKEITIKKDEKVTFEFCNKYGIDGYSISALNYLNPEEDEDEESFNSFSHYKNPSLGNYLIYVENDDYDIEIKTSDGIQLVAYAYDISRKKRASYVGLLGLFINDEFLNNVSIGHTNSLIESNKRRSNTLRYPMLYSNPVTGKAYTCECFRGTLSDKEFLFNGNEIDFKEGICDYCNKTVPKYNYGYDYNSLFRKRFELYHQLLLRKKHNSRKSIILLDSDAKKINDEIENELREHFGYPKLGERWISETLLYKLTCLIFSEEEVVFHYRGSEMEGLEIDIWIPEYKIGIEYQGIQHYKSVEHWGGEEGLKKRQLNDQRKKGLFLKNGYYLVEYMHNEEVSEETLKKKLNKLNLNISNLEN